MDVILMIFIATFVLFIALLLDNDILSPLAVFSESFLLSFIILSININEWNVNLSLKTIGIFLLGYLTFVFVTIVCKRLYDKQASQKEPKRIKNKLIVVNKYCYTILLFISIIIAFLYCKAFYNSVGGVSSLEELSRAINYYRISVSYNLGDAIPIPTIITQLYKILKMFSLVAIYVFANNYFYKKRSQENVRLIIYLIPILIVLPLTLLTGNRIEMATLIIAIIIIFNIMSQKYGYKLNLKTIQKYFVLLICGICLFSFTKDITGRTSASKGFDYFSIYFGAPVELFDLYMKSPKTKSEFFGKETFWSANNFIRKIQGKNEYLIHLPARDINGNSLGNVYTAYRNIYQDFGLIGLILLVGFEALVFSKMYYTIKSNSKVGIISIYEIMYALMMHVLFFFAFSEQFYNSVISINYVILLILAIFIKYFLTKIKIERS